MTLDDIRRMIAPLSNRVANMVSRGIVKLIDDSKEVQELQIGLLDDETRDDVERLQNYGFTSVPLKDAEAAVLFVGGRRDHGLIIAVDDRRYRVKGLENGEVAVYTDQGDKIVFKRGGMVELTATTKFLITCPLVECGTDLKVNGKLDVTGVGTFSDDVNVTKTLTATTDVVGGGKHLKTHVHSYTDADTASGGSGGTKDTAAPT